MSYFSKFATFLILWTFTAMGSDDHWPTKIYQASKRMDHKKTVYCDGVYDLGHYGHARSFAKARETAAEFFNLKEDEIRVLVGVYDNNGHLEEYKRKPAFKLSQRVKQVMSFRDVDAVIENSPTETTEAFMKGYGIDLVVHGDDFSLDQIKTYYKYPYEHGMFATFPYEPGVSTSQIVKETALIAIENLLNSGKILGTERLNLFETYFIIKRAGKIKSV